MDLLPGSLLSAAHGARTDLASEARRTVEEGARASGPARTGAGLALAARSAVFADAVLGASKARLAELRSVAR